MCGLVAECNFHHKEWWCFVRPNLFLRNSSGIKNLADKQIRFLFRIVNALAWFIVSEPNCGKARLHLVILDHAKANGLDFPNWHRRSHDFGFFYQRLRQFPNFPSSGGHCFPLRLV